ANDANGSSTQTAESTRSLIANTAPVNSAVPTISGTAAVGGTLSASTGTWSDTDSDTVTYSYQWYRATDAAGTGETAITGATAATYALSSADAHKFVRVVVTANDANGSTTQTSASARSGVANTAPSLASPAVLTFADTARADTFANRAGSLAASDTDTDGLTFGIDGGITGGAFTSDGITYDVSRTGVYGTLHVNSATGAFVLVPNGVAINATNAATGESFTVTASDGRVTSSTTLSVAVAGTVDAPIAANDTGSALEAGGISNGTAGSNATGNVLTNDTDADTGLTRTVAGVRLGAIEGSGNAGSVGTALAGLYGSLTLKADGTYTYAVNNDNAAVNALGADASLSESFNYTVSNGALTDTAVLTVTIKGAEDTVAAPPPPPVTPTTPTPTAPTTTDVTPTTPTAPIILPLFTPTSSTNILTSTSSNPVSSFSSNSLNSNSSLGSSSSSSSNSSLGSNSSSNSNSNSPSTPASPDIITPTLTTTAPQVSTTPSGNTASSNSSSLNSISLPASQSSLISVGPSTAGSSNGAGAGIGSATGTGLSSEGGAISTGLTVRSEVASQQVGGTSGDSFKIPSGVFGHTDPNAVVTIQATLEDGSPLPSWLKFDAGTGTFSGKPPEGEKQDLQIKVTARDNAGSEATVNFKLDVNENGDQPAGEGQDGQNNAGQQRTDAGRPADRQTAQAPLLGRPSLTAQLKAASGQNGFMAEGLALLESLLKAAGIDETDKAA
ncbi:hypothetical protein N826_23730, partial [Skermanella aerolata KACC 11604]|uniref:VCBS domain-containing protein n=2 Tax=Skermanella aerolata TaxID=393310 RepID=UPI0005C931D6